jgi:hypothetical protein
MNARIFMSIGEHQTTIYRIDEQQLTACHGDVREISLRSWQVRNGSVMKIRKKKGKKMGKWEIVMK